MKSLFILSVLIIFGYIVLQACIFYHYVKIGRELVRASRPYERAMQNGKPRILILGDSTAVGVGVDDPQFSTAGRFGAHYERATIINRGRNGAKITNVIAELLKLSESEHYDLILIQVGANDIIFFSRIAELPLDRMLSLAKNHGDTVVWLTAGNIGLAPLFPWPLSSILTVHTRALRALAIEAAARLEIIYVDLFAEKGSDPFERDIEHYYAPDREHLSREGYGYWYTRIQEELTKHEVAL